MDSANDGDKAVQLIVNKPLDGSIIFAAGGGKLGEEVAMGLFQPFDGFVLVVDGIAEDGELGISVVHQPLERVEVGKDRPRQGGQLRKAVVEQKFSETVVAFQTLMPSQQHFSIII